MAKRPDRIRRIRSDELSSLQGHTDKIRNICVLAHVDHGKTSLTDCLVSSNGIISPRLAGEIRFLDSREDEQERGITMESSAISLLYDHTPIRFTPKSGSGSDVAAAVEKKTPDKFLINLIDSPGHVDFSSDVSTAVRLCDGALVVVDVIEGVCIQTHAVLRQAWEERLRPCLVLNKIDRLILELNLEPVEAYEHLARIIEQVNAVISGFVNASALEEDADEYEKSNNNPTREKEKDHNLDFDEAAEQKLFFSPERGNVAFSCAVDNWAFRIVDFVPLISTRIPHIPPRKLLRALWGDYFYNAKTKQIQKMKQRQASESYGQSKYQGRVPMFASYILSGVIDIYRACITEPKPKKLLKIVSALGIQDKINERELNKMGKGALRTIMANWMPVSRALLSMVVRCVPSPRDAQLKRVDVLWPSHVVVKEGSEENVSQKLSSETIAGLEKVRKAIEICDTSSDAPLVMFVSKMFAVPRNQLPSQVLEFIDTENIDAQTDTACGDENTAKKECFIAFARVFSGTAKPGESVYVLGPKYFPDGSRDSHKSECPKGFLPMMIMGTDLVPLDQVPAGNILALAGLSKYILKTSTLTNTIPCYSITPMPAQSAAILRVSVEPLDPLQWPQLVLGLKLLNRADAVVDVRLQSNGEYILGAIGELHLERCIKDLTERFAGIKVKVSEPIAVFRESLVVAPEKSAPDIKSVIDLSTFTLGGSIEDNDKHNNEILSPESSELNKNKPPIEERVLPGGRIEVCTPNREVEIVLRVVPLPIPIVRVIEKYQHSFSSMIDENEELENDDGVVCNIDRRRSSISAPQALKHKFISEVVEAIDENENIKVKGWRELFSCLWAFGPHGIGPNVLLNKIPSSSTQFSHFGKFGSKLFKDEHLQVPMADSGLHNKYSVIADEIANGIESGFELAMRSGPLCEEPLWGTGVIVESIIVKESLLDKQQTEVGTSVHAWEIEKAMNPADNILGNDLADNLANANVGPISGQVMSAVKEGIRKGFEIHKESNSNLQVRLCEGIYLCQLQCHVDLHSGDTLGKLYSVISKRRGKVTKENMWEGTSIFTIDALIPVVECFGLADDLRKQTSGAASTPQLVFSHWEILDENPYFKATTVEELEEYGENGYETSYMKNNVARKYMMQVRKRKGLDSGEKIVVFAEKQRTLTKMK